MLLWCVAIGLILCTHGFAWWAVELLLLRRGTALVYPTLLAAVSDVVHPSRRASAVDVYRLWRDSGYAIGALLAGVLADLFGITLAIGVIGGLISLSRVLAQLVMAETLPRISTHEPTAAFLIQTEKRMRLGELYQLPLSFTFILSPMRNTAIRGDPLSEEIR